MTRSLVLVMAILWMPGCVTFFRVSELGQGETVSGLQARNHAWQARNAGSVASSLSIALAGSAVAFGTAAALEVNRAGQFGVLPVVLLSNALFDLLLSVGYAVSSFQAEQVALDWLKAPEAPKTP